jgi:3-dehydroquinate dehydratase/shikimate dehydrogenase
MAHSLSDNLHLLQLERAANTVLIGMGRSGAPTRVLAAHFHSHWSYAGDGVAPGQISAPRMLEEFRFREVSEQTAIYGVVGSPLTHSVSPAMHNAAFRAAGVDAVYVPMVASSAEDFTIFATALGVQGVSITIPFKVGLFERADEMDELSRRVGAVNTYRRDGLRWEGRNTDVSGFLAPLNGRLDLQGARAAILGAGGAARAVAVALASAGSVVTVYARNRGKAKDVARLADGMAGVFPIAPQSWDLLVNTTPVGMFPEAGETPFEGPFDGQLVYDLVYNPIETRLLKDAVAARSRRHRTDRRSMALGHRRLNLLAGEVQVQVLTREIGHRLARRVRGAADVRHEHDVVEREQRSRDVRLVLEHVERGAGDRAALECRDERDLVDDGAARYVDQVAIGAERG